MEDPAAKALRDQERRRAEAARLRATQDQLQQETLLRSRKIGSLLGGSTGSLLGSG